MEVSDDVEKPPSPSGYKDCESFQKVVKLKDGGMVVYCHNTNKTNAVRSKIGESSLNTSTAPVASSVEYTRDDDDKPHNLSSSAGKINIICPRCRSLKERAQQLLLRVTSITESNVMGVCDHCRLKAVSDKTYYENLDSVNKSLLTSDEQSKDTKNNIKIWLNKMGHLIKGAVVSEQEKKIKHLSFSDIKLDQQYSPTTIHEPEVKQMFQSETPKVDTGDKDNIKFKIQDVLSKSVAFAENDTFAVTPYVGGPISTVLESPSFVTSGAIEQYEIYKASLKPALKSNQEYKRDDVPILSLSFEDMDINAVLKKMHDLTLRHIIKANKESSLTATYSDEEQNLDSAKHEPRKQTVEAQNIRTIDSQPYKDYDHQTPHDTKIIKHDFPTITKDLLLHTKKQHELNYADSVNDLSLPSATNRKLNFHKEFQDKFLQEPINQKGIKYKHLSDTHPTENQGTNMEENTKNKNYSQLRASLYSDENLKLQRVPQYRHDREKPSQSVEGSENEISKIKKDISAKRRDIYKKKISESIRELFESKKEITESKKGIPESNKEIYGSKKEISGSKKEIPVSNKGIFESKKDIPGSKKDISESKKETFGSKKEISESKKEIPETKKEMYKSKIEISESKKKIAESKKEMYSSKIELSESKKDMYSSKIELSESKKTIPESKKDMSESKKGMPEIKTEISEGKKGIPESKKDISESKQEISESKKEMYSSKTELSERKKRIPESKKDMSESKKEIPEIKTEISEGKKGIPESKKDISVSKREMYRSKIGISESQKGIPESKKDISVSKREMYRSKIEISESQKEMYRSKIEISESKKEMQESKKGTPESNKEIYGTKKEISGSKKEIPVSDKDISESTKELPGSKKYISESKKEIPVSKRNISDSKKEVIGISGDKKEISVSKKEIPESKKGIPESKKGIPESKKESFDRIKEIDINKALKGKFSYFFPKEKKKSTISKLRVDSSELIETTHEKLRRQKEEEEEAKLKKQRAQENEKMKQDKTQKKLVKFIHNESEGKLRHDKENFTNENERDNLAEKGFKGEDLKRSQEVTKSKGKKSTIEEDISYHSDAGKGLTSQEVTQRKGKKSTVEEDISYHSDAGKGLREKLEEERKGEKEKTVTSKQENQNKEEKRRDQKQIDQKSKSSEKKTKNAEDVVKKIHNLVTIKKDVQGKNDNMPWKTRQAVSEHVIVGSEEPDRLLKELEGLKKALEQEPEHVKEGILNNNLLSDLDKLANQRIKELASDKNKSQFGQKQTIERQPSVLQREQLRNQLKDIELKIQQVKMVNTPSDDLILTMVKLRQSTHPSKSTSEAVKVFDLDRAALASHKNHIRSALKLSDCIICNDSELELDIESLRNRQIRLKKERSEIIVGENIYTKNEAPLIEKSEVYGSNTLLFESDDAITQKETEEVNEEKVKPKIQAGETLENKGVIRYQLSDRTFIEKGWTMLPTEKVVQKMNVYRMRPAHPEFDWFKHNKSKRVMTYDTGEKLAEFDDNGRGRWFYRNGRVALDYYDAEEINAQQRYIVFSNGERDDRGRSHPTTILASFDYLGNGVVFDHSGKIRLKYNQTEGVVLDRDIGPVSHWKWHTLNDPPVLQQVMIDTQLSHKDPEIMKLGTETEDITRPDNEEMLAIEFDNFIKEKSKKLSQKFKPFQIKMKALKINDNFSLKVLDQATVYLIFRDGMTSLKLNIGMILDHREIVDTDTQEVGEVSNSIERLPARTDSLARLQQSVADAQRYDRQRTERERRLRPPGPVASADKLTAAASPPLRLPLRTLSTNTMSSKMSNNLYYSTHLC